jgi:hypothetical protein
LPARVEKAISDLTSGLGCRYDTMRDHVAGLKRFEAMGRVGVPKALEQLHCAYVLEVTDTRPQEVADAEFLRFTAGAAALVAATLPQQVQIAVPSTDANGLNDSAAEQVQDSLSWEAIDLTGLLAGDIEPVVPTLFERTDGHCLLYPGLVHSFHGESESAKSLLLQAESVRLIGLGHDVLYIDFESDANPARASMPEIVRE